MQRPHPDEHSAMFRPYIDRVPDGDVLQHLREQGPRTQAVLRTVDDRKAMHRYAAGKWTIKRVIAHLADGERMFCYRALCIARGDPTPLPGFDENLYADNDGSDDRPMADLAAELASVRAATVTLFAGFGAAAWQRRGIANDMPVSLRSLPWIIAGHELHHLAVLRERYGVG